MKLNINLRISLNSLHVPDKIAPLVAVRSGPTVYVKTLVNITKKVERISDHVAEKILKPTLYREATSTKKKDNRAHGRLCWYSQGRPGNRPDMTEKLLTVT